MTKKSNELAMVKLEEAIEANAISAMVDLKPTAQALAMSRGIQEISKALDPLMDEFMPLAGDSLGFKMDEDTYPKPVVRRAMVEALLRGLPLVGNNFNVIAKRCYVTLEGYTLLVQNYPGVTDLVIKVAEPDEIRKVDKNAAAHMPVTATWKIDGVDQEFTNSYRVVMYAGNASFYDGLVGKAKRRALKDVYTTLVGGILAPPEADDPDTSEIKDVTPSGKPEKDPELSESEKGMITLLEWVGGCETEEQLAEASVAIAEAKKAGTLSPSHLKKLGAAYTAKLGQVSGESD